MNMTILTQSELEPESKFRRSFPGSVRLTYWDRRRSFQNIIISVFMPFRYPFFALVITCSMLGYSAISYGQTERSVPSQELLQKELELDPSNIRVALLLGGMLRQEGNAKEAYAIVEKSINALEQRIASEGDSPELLYFMGMGALFLQKDEMALQNFQTALALEPEREEIHLGLIRSLLNLNRREEAAYSLELALTLFPESEIVKQQLVEAYEYEGRFAEAIPFLEELIVLYPENPAVFDRLLTAYVQVGNAEKAAPLFDQLAKNGSISKLESILNVYRIHLANDDLRSARIELQRAAQLDKDHPIVADAFREYYSLQAKQAEEDDNYRRAILFWERAVESFPEDWDAQYSLTLAHAKLKDHEEAFEGFVKLAEKQPADPVFYANFSRTLIELKRFEAAKKVIELGITIASQKVNRLALAELESVRNELARAMGLTEWPMP